MAWIDRCPIWEYRNIPDCDVTLKARAMVILRWIAAIPPSDKLAFMFDTRTVHARYFQNLTPPRFPHYAGPYRGENFECLVDYEVSISTNPLVGHVSNSIPIEMELLKPSFRVAVTRIDEVWPVNEQ